MLEYLNTAECRMVFLRRQLDDPTAAPCGRCGRLRTGTVWSPEVAASDTEAARMSFPGWGWWMRAATAMAVGMEASQCRCRGASPLLEQAEPGRVIGRLSDIGWGARLRELLNGAYGAGGLDAGRVDAGGDSMQAASTRQWITRQASTRQASTWQAPTSRCRRTCWMPVCGCSRAGTGRVAWSAWSAWARAPARTSSPTWPGASLKIGLPLSVPWPRVATRGARQLGPAARCLVRHGRPTATNSPCCRSAPLPVDDVIDTGSYDHGRRTPPATAAAGAVLPSALAVAG